MKLTDQTVRSLPLTDGGQRDYADEAVPGLCVRVGMASKTFRLVVGKMSTRKRFTLGRYDPPHFTLAMAREKARDILAAHRLAPPEERITTCGDALRTFFAAYQRKASTRHETERLLNKYLAGLADRSLASIKSGDIADIIDGLKPSEGKHALVASKTFFKWCAGRGYVQSSPVVNLSPMRTNVARERVLTPEELRAVWSACFPVASFPAIVRLGILTGQRRAQLGALRGEFIDREKQTITWPGELMKGNRSHTIPYGPLTAALLAPFPAAGLLFPTENDEAFNAWGSTKERFDNRLKIQHWTLHDLRRTYSTCMASLDVPPHITERLLDHRSGVISGVSAIYNRYSYMKEMREAVEKYEAYLASLFGVVQTPPPHMEHTNGRARDR